MSLIIKKFDYASIHRKSVDGKRLYECPDGNAVASVTTILDKTKDKTHLIEWRKRIGEKRAQEITTEAAGRGTRMHKFLEIYVETGSWPEPGTNPYSIQAHKMAERIRDSALVDLHEAWGQEINLFFPKIYAGTTDLIGVYKGRECIMDYKQTNKPKQKEWVEDYYLQMVAYAEAHNEIYGTKIKEGHIFMCSQDFQYQQFDLLPEEYDYWKDRWWRRVEQYYLNN
jgi:ATP-dependent exoDNAse (exonuclease V) beta subunit